MPKNGEGKGIQWLRAHVQHADDACLIWPFCRHQGDGYGRLGYLGKMFLAHRLMCILVNGEPPGTCPEGKTSARSCQETIDRLMMNAWVRAAAGGKEPQAPIEMLRAVTGFSWEEIERMSDAAGRGSHTIAEMKAVRG